MRAIRPVLSTVVGTVCAAGLNGCTVGPDFLRPKASAEAGYTPGKPASETASANVPGGASQRFIEAKDIPGQWGTLFHSAQLNALIEEAFKANPCLARQQYDLGAVSYLTLLNAEQTYRTALLNRVRAQAAHCSDTVALFQALGGGWSNRSDVAPEIAGTPDRFALPPVQEIRLPSGLNGSWSHG